MKETKSFLEKLGLPIGDDYGLPPSEKRFADGAQYRFEVPGIQGPVAMKALLEEVELRDLTIHRITQTKGIMLLSDADIAEMVNLASKAVVDLVLSVGPRATYDTGASVQTFEGKRMGLRLRGQDQIVRAVEDIKRASGLGCNSFLVYDFSSFTEITYSLIFCLKRSIIFLTGIWKSCFESCCVMVLPPPLEPR